MAEGPRWQGQLLTPSFCRSLALAPEPPPPRSHTHTEVRLEWLLHPPNLDLRRATPGLLVPKGAQREAAPMTQLGQPRGPGPELLRQLQSHGGQTDRQTDGGGPAHVPADTTGSLGLPSEQT